MPGTRSSEPIHVIRRLDPSVGCYFVRWVKPMTADGYRGFLDDLLRQPAFRPEMCSLHDYRGVGPVIDMAELKRAAAATVANASRRGPSRAAILVDNDLNYGLARIYAAQVDGPDTVRMVFRDPREALRWLGVPEDYPLPVDPPAEDRE